MIPVKREYHDPSHTATVQEFAQWLPVTENSSTPHTMKSSRCSSANQKPTITLDEASHPTAQEVQKMLSFIPPTLPYTEYLAIWMGVASAFPHEDGLQMVDQWSSQAREDNGQSCSPRRQPEKHYTFKRTEGNVSSIATVYHHATKGGYVPPEPPRPTMIRRKHEPEYRVQLAKLHDPEIEELPYLYQQVYAHLGALAAPFSRDFVTGMIAANMSMLFPHMRFENLNLSLWFLGVAESSSGKNELSDALEDVFNRANPEARRFSSGTPQGLYRVLEGDGKAVHCYHAEYGAFLAGLRREYMSGAKDELCNLYDGRKGNHQRSRDGLDILNPYVSVVATTTQESIRNNMEHGDIRSGYASRFLIPFSDTVSVGHITRPTEGSVRALVELLLARKQEMKEVRWVMWDGEMDTDPEPYSTYMLELGIGTGKIRRFEDALDDVGVPGKRHLARIKKLASSYEACERSPKVLGNTLFVRESNTALATLQIKRWSYGALALYPLVTTGKDESLMQTVVSFLRNGRLATMMEIVKKTHAETKDIKRILEFLIDEQEIKLYETAPGAVPRFGYIGRGA